MLNLMRHQTVTKCQNLISKYLDHKLKVVYNVWNWILGDVSKII